MKLMGLDYGKKRVGVALSDDSGRLAFPKTILANTPKLISELAKIVTDEKVSLVVVGESSDSTGVHNAIEEKTRAFISEFERVVKIPIEKQKEFFTSVESRRDPGKMEKTRKPRGESKRVDAQAASLILQRYLDKINK